MANDITTKVWDLDTVGVVSVNPVIVDGVSITWTSTVGTIKTVVISQLNSDNQSAGSELLSVTELSTIPTSGNLTRFYPVKGTFNGLHMTTITSAAKILVYTK